MATLTLNHIRSKTTLALAEVVNAGGWEHSPRFRMLTSVLYRLDNPAMFGISSPPTSRPSKPEPRGHRCPSALELAWEHDREVDRQMMGLSDGEADMLTRVWGGR